VDGKPNRIGNDSKLPVPKKENKNQQSLAVVQKKNVHFDG